MGEYRIQTVAKMTGVAAPTLRSWERRYGIPSPRRTASSYRLYSDEDIALVSAMRDLCAEGVPASEAARRAATAVARAAVPTEQDPFRAQVDRLLQAAESFDVDALELEARRVMTSGSAPVMYERIISPLMHEVGTLWASGRLTVAQEHTISNVMESVLRDMLRVVQPTDSNRVALLGCFAHEEHTFGMYGIALRLATWGFRCIILGARCPPFAIRDAVEGMPAALVGLSVVIAPPPEEAAGLVQEYAQACGQTPWFVGGSAAQEIADTVEKAGGITHTHPDVQHLRAALERAVAKHRSREQHV